MAGFVSPTIGTGRLAGLSTIFEFTNADGRLVRTNCGQAAAATFLTHHGRIKPTEQWATKPDNAGATKPGEPGASATGSPPHKLMSLLEASHPPDQVAGFFGTSRRRVIRICRAFGIRLKEIRGEPALIHALELNRPVLVMLGVSGGKLLGRDLPGGHWMVAYACDQGSVHLTNWGAMPWAEFRRGWNALVPALIQMRGRGLVADNQEE